MKRYLIAAISLLAACNSGERQGTIEVAKNEGQIVLPATMPANWRGDVREEMSQVKVELAAQLAEQMEVINALQVAFDTEVQTNLDLRTKLNNVNAQAQALGVQVGELHNRKTTIGIPTWGILGIVGMFLGFFLFAEWRARRHGYDHGRRQRMRVAREAVEIASHK